MIGLVPLLAAEWWTALIWLVIIAIGAINQIFGGDKKKKPAAPQPPKPAAGPAPGNKGLIDEVEQFLKEARSKMQRPQAEQRPPQPKPAKPPKPQRAARPAGRGAPKRPALSEESRAAPSAYETEEVTRGGSVAEHVQQHLDAGRFDERAGRLSHLKQSVDQDIGAHVQAVFDHQVGTLGIKPTITAPTTTADASQFGAAADLIAMLRDPATMRTAVLMHEILRPPEERW